MENEINDYNKVMGRYMKFKSSLIESKYSHAVVFTKEKWISQNKSHYNDEY